MKVEAYKRFAYWPLNILAVLFLFVFCASNFQLQIAMRNSQLFSIVDKIIWALFLLDYLIMFGLSHDRKKYFKSHLFQLVVVFVPFLRIFRIGMLVLVIFSALGNLKNRILVSIPIYTFTASLLFVLVGAASVFDAESRSDDSNIRTREDALWWAVVTIFTVGYGDRFPVTSEGRLYGVGLMICGIAIVGSVTATFASWLVNQVRRVESENERIEVKLDRIEDSLRRIQS